jgi:hypothetical protein
MINSRMGWACGTLRRKERCMQDFGMKNLRELPLVRPRRTWKGDIKVDLKETGWDAVGWMILLRIWTGGVLLKTQ